MENAPEPFLTFLNGRLSFSLLRNIKQNPLPVTWASIFISDKIRVFLDPNRAPIPPDQPIFFSKCRPISMRFFIFPGDPFPIIWVYTFYPNIRVGRSEERRVGKECRYRWW